MHDIHEEHGATQSVIVAGGDTYSLRGQTVGNWDQGGPTEAGKGDEVQGDGHPVEPVAEVDLHHLQELAGVKEEGVDFGQECHTVESNADPAVEVVPEHGGHLQAMRKG